MAAAPVARESLPASLRDWRLWLIQIVANPALFGLFSVWLLIPEASTLYLILHVLIALVIFLAVIALHGGTLNYFRDRAQNERAAVKSAFLRAIRNILAITISLVVFYLLWWLISLLGDYRETLPTYLRSTFPAFMRRHVSYQFLVGAFSWVIFSLRWFVLPGMLLPFVANAADNGFRGLGRPGVPIWWGFPRSWSYWLIVLLAVVVGVLAPFYIMNATPDYGTSTTRYEWFSLISRFSAAYLLALSAWFLVSSMVGRKSLRATGTAADLPRNPGA